MTIETFLIILTCISGGLGLYTNHLLSKMFVKYNETKKKLILTEDILNTKISELVEELDKFKEKQK